MLDARAFVAQTALLFPEEARLVGQSLVRSEMASLDAQEMHLEPPAEALKEALQLALRDVERGLDPEMSLSAWCELRFSCNLKDFQAALLRRLENNLRYQMAVRARLQTTARHQMLVVSFPEKLVAMERATAWRSGADPRQTQGCREIELSDKTFLAWTGQDPALGILVGPIQLPESKAWHLLRIGKPFPPTAIPPAHVLVQWAREDPLDPLEAQAWWGDSLARYTAKVTAPVIQSGPHSFVPR